MALIILLNYLISIYDIYKKSFSILLKKYTKKTFHQLISINQYFCYIFFLIYIFKVLVVLFH